MQKFPRGMLTVFWILYETLVNFHVVIPVVYWVFLSSSFISNPSPIGYWLNLFQHAFDGGFLLFEILLNRHPFVIGHLIISRSTLLIG
jgi:hypothetical protein